MKMKNKQTKEGGCLEEGGVGRKWTRRVRTPNLVELLGGFKEEKQTGTERMLVLYPPDGGNCMCVKIETKKNKLTSENGTQICKSA